MKHRINQTVRVLACLLAVACLLPLASCAAAWDWLWERESAEGPGSEAFLPESAEAETTIVFEGAVEFDESKTHSGSDIYYVGKSDSPNRNRIVVIDAGHQRGGNSEQEAEGPGSYTLNTKVTAGATGTTTGQFEYELNLDVALMLRNILIDRGYSVVMIRETNRVDISNKTRAQIANKYNEYGTAIFIRIHANSWTDESMNGAMTICQSAKNPYPTCVSHYEESRLLSELVLEAYCEATDFQKLPRREMDNKTGTNWSEVPTTIVEMGFLSNADDDRNLTYAYVREGAAIGMANGIDAFFAHMDGSESETEADS